VLNRNPAFPLLKNQKNLKMKNILSTPGLFWLLLTLACIALALAGLNAALKRTSWDSKRRNWFLFGATLMIVLWAGIISVLSWNGFFANFSKLPPRPALLILIPLPFVFLFAFSSTGTKLLGSVPPQWLVFFQSFRIAVELLLLLAFIKGGLPQQMTFEGRNFDIITGLLALPVGYLVARKKAYSGKLAIVFNIIGIVLLLNILVVAVLSMPTPIRYFMNEPANTLVAEFPFILLPGILVPLAYTLHIFSLRQQFINNRKLI
jgi:hypothetical protein